MPFISGLPEDATVLELFESDPRYAGVVMLVRDWMRGPSELSVQERELLAAYVSALNACPFCVGAHKALAEAYGVDPELLNVIIRDEPAGAPERLKPVLELARKVTCASGAVTEGDLAAVLDVGFTEDTVHVIVAVAGLFSMINRMVDAHGIKAAPGQTERIMAALGPQAGSPLQEFGRH